MTYDELLQKQESLYAELDRISNEIKETEHKISKAKNGKAKDLFDGIIKSLLQMAALGYTITVKTEDAEWGGENWHEMGISLRDIEMTETDQQEAIFEILKNHPTSAL